MSKRSIAGFGGFFKLVVNSIDGKTEGQKSVYIAPAVIALILWLLLSSLGLQQVYQRIGLMSQVWNTINNPESSFQDLKDSDEFYWPSQNRKEEAEKFLWPWQSRQEEKISPFWQVFIAGLAAIIFLSVFLKIMSAAAGTRASFDSIITNVGICSVPLTIGMIISYCFYSLADAIGGENFPAILYVIGTLALTAATMTALIVLYVGVHNLLGLKERKRYVATILGTFIASGAFAWISQLLMK